MPKVRVNDRKSRKSNLYSPLGNRFDNDSDYIGKSMPAPKNLFSSDEFEDKKDLNLIKFDDFKNLSSIDFDDDIDDEIKEVSNESENEEDDIDFEEKKNILTFDEVEDYLNEKGIDFDVTANELRELIQAANESPYEYSLEEFCKSLPTAKEIDNYDEACDEEKKGNLVSRIAAPKWVRDTIYSTDKKNNKHYHGLVNGEHNFECMYCNKPVILDKNGKEKGFATSNSKSKRQPPVCHGKTYPAVYVRNGINEIIDKMNLDSTLLKHCMSTNSIIQDLVWKIGIGEMMPGHTKCNVGDKDTRYGDLKGTDKKNLLKNLESFMKLNGPKGELLLDEEEDISNDSYLGKMMNELKNFKKTPKISDDIIEDKKDNDTDLKKMSSSERRKNKLVEFDFNALDKVPKKKNKNNSLVKTN